MHWLDDLGLPNQRRWLNHRNSVTNTAERFPPPRRILTHLPREMHQPLSLCNLCVLCVFLETRSSGCAGNQLKAKGLSLSFQMIDAPLFVPLFISLLTDFNVTCALGQHRIKNARY